jgi:hypothetical protein
MSADTINQNIASTELPVWTIHGANWQVDIPLNEYNAQCEPEMQAMEAASKAIMVFKGKCPEDGLMIRLDEGEETPFIGPTMIAHLKDTDPTKGFIPFTHMILANEGFYGEADKMKALFEMQIEAIKQDQIKNEKAILAIHDEIKNLKKVKPKKAKTKKPRKKK